MSYRRVARSYRRSVARQYRILEEHPRAHLGVMVGIVVAVLGVVGGMLISAHSGSSFTPTGNAVSLATTCATPSDSTSASTAPTPAASTPAAASPSTTIAPGRRHRHPLPPDTTTPSVPAASPTDPSAPSMSATPSATVTGATTAPAPRTSV